MSEELETRLRQARPELTRGSAAAQARVADKVRSLPRRSSIPRWLNGNRLRIVVIGVALAGGGAAFAAGVISQGTSSAPVAAPLPSDVGWGTDEVLSDPLVADFDEPVVGVAADGGVTVAWSRGLLIEARHRPPGGPWGPVEVVYRDTRPTDQPEIAVGPDGLATVVWRHSTGGERVSETFTLPGGREVGTFTAVRQEAWSVLASTRDARGNWSTAEPISPESNNRRDFNAVQIGAAADGTAVALWWRGRLIASRHKPPGEDWGPVREIARLSGAEVRRPSLGVSPSGLAVAAWTRAEQAVGNSVWAAQFDGSEWSRPAELGELTTGGTAPFLGAAAADSGRAIVVWPTSVRASDGRSRYRPAVTEARDGIWGPAHVFTGVGGDFLTRAGAALAPGGAAVIWNGFVGQRQAAGAWMPSRATPDSGGPGALERDADGVLAVWPRLRGPGLLMRRWVPGTGFGEITEVNTRQRAEFGVRAAANSGGTAAVVWSSPRASRSGQRWQVRAIVRDSGVGEQIEESG